MQKRSKTPQIMKEKARKHTSKKKELDLGLLVNIAVRTGKTIIGSDTLLKHLYTEEVKLILLAKNCPAHIRNQIELLVKAKQGSIPIYVSHLSSLDLGTAAGKPFMIAAMAILNPGDSSILDAVATLNEA
jgi:large subunit ribosomal protein L30e